MLADDKKKGRAASQFTFVKWCATYFENSPSKTARSARKIRTQRHNYVRVTIQQTYGGGFALGRADALGLAGAVALALAVELALLVLATVCEQRWLTCD